MKLEKLNPSDETLSREQMLALAGGNTPSQTFTRAAHLTGTEEAIDYDDAD
ncbi:MULTISPECIES: hypothetical protein [unclassified Chitinophaga]|uniref:hypothetical protein n=1 Tax=unclassified Chitinophaga TaxID=2619133 RepID=UPI0015C36FB2|nr:MULTISPECIES: hypothetical protein [unclassified Chitinophaga]WPV67022.1 hypothetical protein QQL36_35095 [Chitinophaga sp. LS1]